MTIRTETTYVCDRCGAETSTLPRADWGTFYIQQPQWQPTGINLIGDPRHACGDCWPIVHGMITGTTKTAKEMADSLRIKLTIEEARLTDYLPKRGSGGTIDPKERRRVEGGLEAITKVRQYINACLERAYREPVTRRRRRS